MSKKEPAAIAESKTSIDRTANNDSADQTGRHSHTPAPRVDPRLRRMRALIAIAVTVAVGGLLAATASQATPAMQWWIYPVVLAGAALAGLVGATYLGAARGAEATVCDLRWPIFGIFGIILAVDPNGRFLDGLFGFAGAGVARPIIGIAALALLAWALRDRVTRERTALAEAAAAALDPDSDPDAGIACTTCTPLFPNSNRSRPDTRP